MSKLEDLDLDSILGMLPTSNNTVKNSQKSARELLADKLEVFREDALKKREILNDRIKSEGLEVVDIKSIPLVNDLIGYPTNNKTAKTTKNKI